LRAVAPLRPADDAFVLDTTDLDADGAFEAAMAHIRETIGAAAEDLPPT
jgi:cytidylate kinase